MTPKLVLSRFPRECEALINGEADKIYTRGGTFVIRIVRAGNYMCGVEARGYGKCFICEKKKSFKLPPKLRKILPRNCKRVRAAPIPPKLCEVKEVGSHDRFCLLSHIIWDRVYRHDYDH